MKRERTPEEKERAKRINAVVMMGAGAVMALCGLAGGLIVLSGRGDAPDWMFGGAPRARAAQEPWTPKTPLVPAAPFGKAVFERARAEGKMVLLFLGPSRNDATRRLDSELFSDPSVAALLAKSFVLTRADADARPDLDRRYRAAGWPTAAVLLPDGTVLDAGVPSAPERFVAWAGALAERAATHPEALARAAEDAAARREAAAASRHAGRTPATAAEADRAAQARLLPSWDPARRTFDARGPRFPRFERAAALARLASPWAKALAPEALKGAIAFQDPADGGFRRVLAPDGGALTSEKTAGDQAAALDALCGPAPASARRLLGFLDTPAGRALPSRPGEEADLARAVLSCPLSGDARRARARRAVDGLDAAFFRRVRAREPGLLMDDALPLGEALLAADRTDRARAVFAWMEEALGDGPAFADRTATGLLPPELDRVPDPGLNARALAFARRLGGGKRAESLMFWLSARPEALDPAVWAALAAEEPR